MSKEAKALLEQLRSDGEKPDVMYKGTYTHVVQSGKLAGQVRSATVACVASSVKDAEEKMWKLINNYGHAHCKFSRIEVWY